MLAPPRAAAPQRVFTAALVGAALLALLYPSSASAEDADIVVTEPDDDDSSTDYAILVGTFTADFSGSDFGLYGLAGGLAGDVEAGVAALGLTYDPGLAAFGGNAFLRAGYIGIYNESTTLRPDPQDDRARFELHWSRAFGDVTVQHRSRLEHRFRDVSDQTRYRPRLRALLDTDGALTPFVSAELFYAFQGDDVQLLLGEAGLSLRLNDRWSVSGSYLTNVAFADSATNIGLVALSTRF